MKSALVWKSFISQTLVSNSFSCFFISLFWSWWFCFEVCNKDFCFLWFYPQLKFKPLHRMPFYHLYFSFWSQLFNRSLLCLFSLWFLLLNNKMNKMLQTLIKKYIKPTFQLKNKHWYYPPTSCITKRLIWGIVLKLSSLIINCNCITII